jgi:hypothetical protein
VLAILTLGVLFVVNDKFLSDIDTSDVKWYLFFDVFALVFIAGLTTPGKRSLRAFARFLAALLPWARSGPGKHQRVTEKARDEIAKSGWDKRQTKSLHRDSRPNP